MVRLIDDSGLLPTEAVIGDRIVWVVPYHDIYEAPTVDAIPVSFIRDLINLARKVGADSHAESLEILLADWSETRQAPKANISPCEGCEDYVYGGGCKRNGECVAR